MAADGAGGFYVAVENAVRHVDAAGVITTVAGTGEEGYNGDGIPAIQANVQPEGIAVDAAGNLYIVESFFSRVRKVDLNGIITTIAGTGENGYNGDGIPATQAQLGFPRGVAVDVSGNVYIADTGNQRIRKVDTNGTITTLAGVGPFNEGPLGDEGDPARARLGRPLGVDWDPTLGVLIADARFARVRQVVVVPDLLAVVKIASPSPVNVGQQLTYTITVNNNGARAASQAILTDTLPASVSLFSAASTKGACTTDNRIVTCPLGRVPAGGTATITVVVSPTTPGLITNTARVSVGSPDPLTANNAATVVTEIGDVDCGKVITANTTLKDDIGPCPRNGLIVGADNITLDLGGHRLFGFNGPGPGRGNTAGIRLPKRTGAHVQTAGSRASMPAS